MPFRFSTLESRASNNYRLPDCCPQKVPATVLYLRVKSDKKPEKTLNKARKELKDIDSGNF
jgi:hypothetical protein